MLEADVSFLLSTFLYRSKYKILFPHSLPASAFSAQFASLRNFVLIYVRNKAVLHLLRNKHKLAVLCSIYFSVAPTYLKLDKLHLLYICRDYFGATTYTLIFQKVQIKLFRSFGLKSTAH